MIYVIMNSDSVKCSVCGGAMRKVTVVSTKEGVCHRYKCTCGHSQDIKEDPSDPNADPADTLILEGFQELPDGLR
jgi:hypothetical protein